jgi:radical SAM superfamily enzyme YgiQ (UPF0313 family)
MADNTKISQESPTLALIQVPTSWDDIQKENIEDLYPFSLLYLASYLKKNNIKSQVIDCSAAKLDLHYLGEHLVKLNPDIIGLTSTTVNRFNTINTAKYIKSILPNVKLILGGRHFSYIPENTLYNVPEVDFVVSGEGEISLLELVNCIRSNGYFDKIKGLTYRNNLNIIRNHPREAHSRIDDFDLLSEEDLNIIGRYSLSVPMRHFRYDSIPILVGRGCPNRCTFCVQRSDTYRVRSTDSIMREIDRKYRQTGSRFISFIDPALTIRKRFVYELCEALDDYPVDFMWYCEGRADTPVETVKRMSSSGCIAIDFALESGSLRVLNAIQKDINLDQIKSFAKLCHSLDIKTLVFTMVSMPEETEEDAQMTLEFLRAISPFVHTCVNAVTQIFVGTKLEIQAREKGILPDSFSWFDESFRQPIKEFGPSTIPIHYEHLSADYIKRWKKEFQKITDKYISDYWFEVKNKISLTVFDWRRENMKHKMVRVKRAVQMATNKLFYR